MTFRNNEEIGSLVRSLVGVPQHRLALLTRIVSSVDADPKGRGNACFASLADFRSKLLARIASEKPIYIELGAFSIDYDEPLSSKALHGCRFDPELFHAARSGELDREMPDPNRGEVRVVAGAVNFAVAMPQQAMVDHCAREGYQLATIKAGVDIGAVLQIVQDRLINFVPLVCAGGVTGLDGVARPFGYDVKGHSAHALPTRFTILSDRWPADTWYLTIKPIQGDE